MSNTELTALAILLFLSAIPAQVAADPIIPKLDNIIQKITYQPPQKQAEFGSFLYDLMALNTPQNIALLTDGMEARGITAVRIYVKDYKQSFYIVSGKGITANRVSHDISYSLTKAQVLRIREMVGDGKITFIEKIQMRLMVI